MTTTEWPINGSDLVRRLGLPHDSYHVLQVVRPLLRDLGCPKTSASPRANWIVDQAMARRVERILRDRGFTVLPQ
jgi:hypothetical protein